MKSIADIFQHLDSGRGAVPISLVKDVMNELTLSYPNYHNNKQQDAWELFSDLVAMLELVDVFTINFDILTTCTKCGKARQSNESSLGFMVNLPTVQNIPALVSVHYYI